MSPSVDIDADVFEYLKAHAEPFTDTPSSVLRRLLALKEPTEPRPDVSSTGAPSAQRSAQDRAAKPRSNRRGSSSRSSNGRTRAPSGTLLPEQRYELPLLRALVEAGGEARSRDVVEAVGHELQDELMPADFETLASGGIRWHSRLQFVRLRLIERGAMDPEALRGIWRVTEAGRQALLNGAGS